jgi:hypothetical protein
MALIYESRGAENQSKKYERRIAYAPRAQCSKLYAFTFGSMQSAAQRHENTFK